MAFANTLRMDTESLPSQLTSTVQTWAQELVALLPNIALAVVVVLGFGFASRWVRAAVDRSVFKFSGNRPISDILGGVARVGTVVLGAFIALSLLDLDKTVTSLLAGVGVLGIALGFAFQDIAANFMSGFLMALRRPFDVGDQVEISDHLCKVKEIALRATTVETTDGLSIIVPNKEVFQNAIVNYTKTEHRRLDLPVGVAYGDDLPTAREVTLDALEGLPGRDEGRDVEVFFTGFGNSSIDLVARIWLEASDQRSYVAARSDAITRIKEAYDHHGITIPFPIRTLDFGANTVGGVRLDEMSTLTEAAE